jgi:methylated-DNA-[protein]-cysteine S-methyltransferase
MKTQLFNQFYVAVVEATPLGPVWVAASETGLIAVYIGFEGVTFSQDLAAKFEAAPVNQKSGTEDYLHQIEKYLHGKRQTFTLPIHWESMSAFQQKSLRAVAAVPYGETRTYGQIAAEIGVPRAPRAVGRANATNPMPLVLPCHRLIGADGSLRGYGGGEGLKTKRWLLDMEKRHSA